MPSSPRANDHEDQDQDAEIVREFSGATITFSEFGAVVKVSLPSDFSAACITGLAPGTTSETLADQIRNLGLDIDAASIRIIGHKDLGLQATVKVEDPLFAQRLSVRLGANNTNLKATAISLDTRQSSNRKIHLSWHKATRTIWLNFGNGDIANRVAEKFNGGRYRIKQTSIRSSRAEGSSVRGGRLFSHNRQGWTIVLSDVPGSATIKDIENAIFAPHDKPRHIEMGAVSYQASTADVSTEIRLRLEECGALERFQVSPVSNGKRIKATALFEGETDARSACKLNNISLDVLGKGKLTMALVQMIKVKILSSIFNAVKLAIDDATKTWKEKHLIFRAYQNGRFTTLKLEGGTSSDLNHARNTLQEIVKGLVIVNEGKAIWDPAFATKGAVTRKLRSIEQKLNVVISRDKAKRQLVFYGPDDRLSQVVNDMTQLLQEESDSSYEIDLKPDNFSWAIYGGFRSIQQALGGNVAVFNVVSRKITVTGSRQQYETAIDIMDGKITPEVNTLPKRVMAPDGDCPICFCEADDPVQTSCKHVYCLGCFEETCKAAASTSKTEFSIKCQGIEGTCPAILSLSEIKDYLPSLVFEGVLKSSFEEHVQRQPDVFRYCPTPDCGYIYRCAASDSPLKSHTCPNCLEEICTYCHARHGTYTCAEYKDIESGGYEALAKLKKELNIKDCPKCSTPMEKTEGCNHMTCEGCKAHICWVCLTYFAASGPCYEHMNKTHGGIGLDDLDPFRF